MRLVKSGLVALERLRGSAREGLGRMAVAYVVLLVALLLTGLASYYVRQNVEAREKEHFGVITSSREQQDMIDGYGLGANSYVRKPVNFEQFVHAVEQLKLYWLILNEAPPSAV